MSPSVVCSWPRPPRAAEQGFEVGRLDRAFDSTAVRLASTPLQRASHPRLEEGGGARNRIDTLARVATALDRHLVLSFPETVPTKLKDAVQVA